MSSKSIKPKPPFSLPERVLLVYTRPDVLLLKRAFKLKKKGSFLLTEVFQREEAVLCGPVLGAPQVAIVLEYLKACGVKEILALGWAGAFGPELPLGSLFLPERALSAEGTSAHYGLFPEPAPSLFWWLYHQLIFLGLDFEVGTIVSTDALFRENEEFRKRFFAASAVDMETSALFSVGRALGLAVASLHIISDQLWPAYVRAPSALIRKATSALFPLFRNFWQTGAFELAKEGLTG